ncbi:DNA-binding IclR family transcriptional regulator [Catenuloplanes nepalensis]|uniref:DNA-binding IclR family transcriptional regulator n=1 Tax=Catenuloplanes nepalensis TaxID=587533 RepID=A0ABT9MXJ1_9ACTN|nr:IclR family transcriptional regulator [Catenuloplanes nepalensis]MDP9796160.1 DNA-binding IclR family transcriptional regulator [Catenuloplanes nepalensis]
MSQSMIGRVVAVLDAVAGASWLSRKELAVATGLPQATCNRIVGRLIEERLLADDGARGLRLGLRLFELGTQAGQAGMTLLDVAGPYLRDLHAAFGWTAQLATRDGLDVIYLLKVDGTARPKLATRVAGRFPPHCTGAGKALLAFAPAEETDDVLARLPLIRRTAATIVGRVALEADLRVTRRRGYAVDREEFQPGMTGVAVPLRPAGEPVAAITLAAPTGTLDVPRAAHALKLVADLIEPRLTPTAQRVVQ